MPQFDKITFFNQIFWLVVSFLGFYFIVLRGLLPVLASSLKTRKKLMNKVFSASTSQEVGFKKSYHKNLQDFLKVYKSLFTSSVQKKNTASEGLRIRILKNTFLNF